MSVLDEPLFDEDVSVNGNGIEDDSRVSQRIRRLLNAQPFAVLCTQGDQQPYGSLIAFAVNKELSQATFVTPVSTRKYKLLSECNRVALLFDNRDKNSNDFSSIEAVTATGRAVKLAPGKEYDYWVELLTRRHGYLKAFVRATSSALFRVDIVRYLHVVRFQEVKQWIPIPPG